MDTTEYMEQGLNGEAPLKVILCGSILEADTQRVGVVSLVFATMQKEVARKRIQQLQQKNPDHYYMVYSVPLDCDLTALPHYPSIAITQKDLE